MARGKGKKSRGKKKKIGHSEAIMKKVKASEVSLTKAAPHAPLTDANATSTGSERENNVGTSQDKEKKNGESRKLSGYIFMCNSTTKLDCYQYRVFGLPLGRKEVVEQITPGVKLFLFDFELKLLYGVYEASSAGKLNLEPGAFNGNFPAQVKFRISKECLPLPESSLRSVITENYTGSKFKQELTRKQVNKLLSTFHPLNASSSRPAVHTLANAGLSHTMLPLATENQIRQFVRLPAEAPYLLGTQYSLTQPLPEHQPISNINILHHGYSRPAAYVDHAAFSSNHPSLPAASNSVTHGVQDLHHSSSYATHEVQDLHHASSYAATHRVQDLHHASSYATHGVQDLHHASSYAVHGVQGLHHSSAPYFGMSGVTANAPSVQPMYLRAPSQYIPPVMQQQQHEQYIPTYHPLPLQREALPQDGVDHNSYHIPPVLQPQMGGHGTTSHGTGSGPVTSYYSYTAAHQSGN